MRFDYWVCDICGKKFEEKDGGYINQHPINIEFKLDTFSCDFTCQLEDTCVSCREKIAQAIEETVKEIRKDK